jgi:tetratricopeptide (TPR) repeat protein
MKSKIVAITMAATLVMGFFASAAEGKKEDAPVGPPQPRVVEPLTPQPLPPREVDPSWLLYQEGVRLFKEKRLGESLESFKKAIESRSSLFERVSADIDAAVATKEAAKAKDSLSALVSLLAARDLLTRDYESIHASSGGSIVAEMGLLRERSPSGPLRGLIDATLLVVEERGLSRIGDSISALKKAAADLVNYPEAEFGIAKIFLAEGEARLAELQMLHAYDMIGSLEVGEDRFALLESLAEIYKSQGDFKDYELRLREIADASDLFSGKDEYYRNAMERTLAAQGFDKFMALYRVQDSFATGAYYELGSLYLEAGRPIAVIYLAAAVNAVLSREIIAIKIDSPSYAYVGLPDLIARILADKELARFASDSGLWRDLVRLGESLAMTGNRDTARELWSAVVNAPGMMDPWKKKASAALAGSGAR